MSQYARFIHFNVTIPNGLELTIEKIMFAWKLCKNKMAKRPVTPIDFSGSPTLVLK